MVTRMQDELDPKLLALFAESQETFPDEEFMRAFWARRERARRRRTLRRVALVAILALAGAWMAPALLEQTAAAMRALGRHSMAHGDLLISPWGWTLSMIFGLAVLVASGALRRR